MFEQNVSHPGPTGWSGMMSLIRYDRRRCVAVQVCGGSVGVWGGGQEVKRVEVASQPQSSMT